MMTVTCDKCGVAYKIDPDKMIAQAVKFKCKTCSNYVRVSKEDIVQDAPVETVSAPPKEPRVSQESEVSETQVTASETKMKGFGIRFKLFLFLFIFIVAFGVQGYYLIQQLVKMTDRVGLQGTEIIKEMAENDIMKTAQSVAKQVKLYLESHPELGKEQFMSDSQFKDIVIQKVGKSGYTALNEQGTDGKWRTWAHVNPNVIPPKLDDMAKLKKPLGENFDGFWKLLTGVKSGKPTKGYYRWQDKDKTFKDKYMVSVNVPGTPFNISATTYIDEFTQPMLRLENESRAIAQKESFKIALLISVIVILFIILVYVFGGRLAANIKYLSEMTDRISLGDLDASIEIRSKDELAVLTESISRLQQSVQMSLQRLRR